MTSALAPLLRPPAALQRFESHAGHPSVEDKSVTSIYSRDGNRHAGVPNGLRRSYQLTRDLVMRRCSSLTGLQGETAEQFDRVASDVHSYIAQSRHDQALQSIGLIPGKSYSEEQVKAALEVELGRINAKQYSLYGKSMYETSAGWDFAVERFNRTVNALRQFYPNVPKLEFRPMG